MVGGDGSIVWLVQNEFGGGWPENLKKKIKENGGSRSKLTL